MKPILFIDFDGTICFDRFWRSIEADKFKQIQDFLFSADISIVNDWMCGAYSSEDINRLVSNELNIPFEILWKTFVRDCRTMTISKNTLSRIRKLKKIYEIVLITDNMDSFTRFTVPAHKLYLFFDSIINSYENKKLKEHNSGEVFLEQVNKRGLKMHDCILIDNSKKICTLFSKLCGTSCFVTQKKPLDYWLKKLSRERFH